MPRTELRRLDISRTVSMVSKYMHDPAWYIHGTTNAGLEFERDDRLEQNLVGFTGTETLY